MQSGGVMRCVLCGEAVDLFELADWQCEPAHRVCAESARAAFDEACNEIARRHRERNTRLGRRYDRLAS